MKVITTTAELDDLCNRLAENDYVTVDTEFLREHTYWPKLCLIQLAADGIEAIVDPLANGLDLEPFYRLMRDESVVKVFHAARQDIEIIVYGSGSIPKPLFDTQVAAMVCGFGESISYVNLVRHVTNTALDKGQRFTDWSKRPLNEKQLTYALADVTHLREVYEYLKTELEKTNRVSWLNEEMAILENPATYRTEPDEAWQRLKARVKNRRAMAVLMEIAAWREQTAQKQNTPRNRVMRDDALYDIANAAPTSAEQLGGLRSVSNGFERSKRGAELLEAVAAGLSRDLDDVPSPKAGRGISAEAAATMELLKVLLKAVAAEHKVAAKMLADISDLEAIAVTRDAEPDVPAMSGWRRRIFGEPALALKRGELALILEDGEVRAIPR
jgi:ribonuclease D